MENSLSEMKIMPDLRDTEELVNSFSGTVGKQSKDNTAVAITSERIFISPKKGADLPDGFEHLSPLDILLDDIQSLRREGPMGRDMELVTEDGEVIQLPLLGVEIVPTLKGDNGRFCEVLAEQAGLVETDWGNETPKQKSGKTFGGLAVALLGVLGLIGALLLILAGAGMMLTISGIITGFGILAVGGLIGWISLKLIEHSSRWGFSRRREWSKRGETH